MTRTEKLRLIWRHTHRDYRGKIAGGAKAIMHWRDGFGTCLSRLDELSEAEIERLLPAALRREAKR